MGKSEFRGPEGATQWGHDAAMQTEREREAVPGEGGGRGGRDARWGEKGVEKGERERERERERGDGDGEERETGRADEETKGGREKREEEGEKGEANGSRRL